jgi:hypothetical protein
MFIALVAGTVAIAALMRFAYGTTPRVTALQTAATPSNARTVIGSWKGEALYKARMNM